RHRMPDLRKQAQAIESEFQSLQMAAVDQAQYLQLAESLASFCGKLRRRADTLDVRERQQILRLLVREVLVDADTITLRHSIPVPQSSTGGTPRPNFSDSPGAPPTPDYLLRTWSRHCSLRCPHRRFRPLAVFRNARLQPFLDQPQHSVVGHSMPEELQQPLVTDVVEEALDI